MIMDEDELQAEDEPLLLLLDDDDEDVILWNFFDRLLLFL